MPADERRTRIDAIRKHVRAHDVSAWIDGLLEDLDDIAKGDNR
jgi:trehalose-6-phosphate synthase